MPYNGSGVQAGAPEPSLTQAVTVEAQKMKYRIKTSIVILPLALALAFAGGSLASAEDEQARADHRVAEEARSAWEAGDKNRSLDLLDQWIQEHPSALKLHKLRGDILSTSRRPQEAVVAYETVLTKVPTAIDVRWAKWSVLMQSGQGEESIAELRRIAQMDSRNPLVHLQLAQELRKLDRLEESLDSYKKAVDLAPEMLGWRLAMARAHFDVLKYEEAERDVQEVLRKMPLGSPLELSAKNLLSQIHGTSIDRGRRFDPVLTRDMTPAQRREWADIRGKAWELFSTGHYREAEPIYRRLLALNPKDPNATHQLGITLMQLGRCKDALTIFGALSNLDPSDEDYADTVFRMGQCLVELQQWEDAFVHFQILYDAAVEFEEQTKQSAPSPDTRVLDKNKIARWLEKVRPHVPEFEKLQKAEAANRKPTSSLERDSDSAVKEILARAAERFKPQNSLDTQAALAGRDSDFSWFRFVIPAGKVMRDDFPTGAHEFLPLGAGDSFPPTQQEIYLVFRLVSDSYDAVPLAAQCFVETAEAAGAPKTVAQDRVMMAMSDQSGYFKLSPPQAGWKPGLYRCGLFAGERATADTHVDDVRFQIIEPPTQS